jgi:tryptophan synthase alpha chain
MNGEQNIQQTFAGGKVFAAYLTAGDGGIQKTLTASLALIRAGVNLLEIGMPFSDPVADGPVIQRASVRALQSGTGLKDILWLAKEIRQVSNIPLVLFSYMNPILSAWSSGFFADLRHAGIDGLLLLDCPLEATQNFHKKCEAHQIAPISIIATSTQTARIQSIAVQAKGFLYYACRKGVTGMRSTLPEDFPDKIAAIRAQTNLPIIAGFGIASRASAEQVLHHADGVVVGSLFVKAIEDGLDETALSELAKNICPFN